jgi:hypothetical protein
MSERRADPSDQEVYLDQADVESVEPPTDTEIYLGVLEAEGGAAIRGADDVEGLEGLADLELRSDETDDPYVAAEEGIPYVPPVDPPVVPDPDDPQGIRIASGFGTSSLDEPFDEDHPSETLAPEDELSARVREALRADASTSRYAEELAIGTRGGIVGLRGVVEDIEDSENVLAVVSYVEGVADVVDELTIRVLER